MFLTIMSPLAMTCAVLYHTLSSKGCLGVTEIFRVTAESVLLMTLILLSSTTLYFTGTVLPSLFLAVTMSLLLFFPCETTSDVSALMVISFSKVFLFLGNCAFDLSSASLPSSLLSSFLLSSFGFLASFDEVLVVFLALVLLLFEKRSLAFLRNGTWS